MLDITEFYYQNVLAWVLNNTDIRKREDIPQVFGEGTTLQHRLSEEIAHLLKI